MGKQLKEQYGKFFMEMISHSHAPDKIDETNVYQEANPELTVYMDKVLEDNFLPGSGLGNVENFKSFYEQVTKEGKRGLILMEHYTNLDLPAIIYLLKNHGEEWSKDFSKRIVAVAGMKLNEASPGVKAWTEGFTRVVIYPTRSREKVENTASEEEIAQETAKAKKINFAAMRAMDACKRRGQVILVFPSGTRYRPGQPETKRGLSEIDSYLRLFDIMLLVSVNGNALRINMETPDDMLSDIVEQDKVVLTASPVLECKAFRNNVLDKVGDIGPEEKKQATIDEVMRYLDVQHDEVEAKR